MQGEIKTYLPEKHYGFIKGDDSKDYFFHEKDFIAGTNLSDLAEGLRIKFEQQATPRGYRARKCQVLQGMEGMRYAVPEDFIVTRKNTVNGWEILRKGKWLVMASSSGSPDQAKKELVEKARMVQANALINLSYSKDTGSTPSESGKGTYYFTIHCFEAQIAFLGKKNIRGSLAADAIPDIDVHAAKKYQEYLDEVQSDKSSGIGCLGFTLVLALLSAIFNPIISLGVLLIGAFVAGSFFSKQPPWLKKMEEAREVSDTVETLTEEP